MHKHLLALVFVWPILALPFFAVAADEPVYRDPPPLEGCTDLSLIAREVMMARQQNRPMSETLGKAIEQVKKWMDKYDLPLIEHAEEQAADMVIDAFEVSIAPVEQYKQQEITEYENTVFKNCYEWLTMDQ